ncbi:unnamed protein product [Brassica oleracea]
MFRLMLALFACLHLLSVRFSSDESVETLFSVRFFIVCRTVTKCIFRKHCVQRDGMVSWNQPSSVPECLSSSHLEILEWRQYKGTKTEIEAAKYILANGNWRLTLFLTFDAVACLWTNMLVTREMRKQNLIDGRLNAENNILIEVIIMNISILIIIITQLKPSAELRPFLVGYNLYHTTKTLVFVSQLLKCFITVSPIELFFITHLLISRFYPETNVSSPQHLNQGGERERSLRSAPVELLQFPQWYQPSYVRLACRLRIDVVLSALRREYRSAECYALP